MNRVWKLAAPLPLLLALGCGPSQEDIDAQVDRAVSEALEAAEEQRPNLTEMDISQHLIDNLDGVDLEMPIRYFSPKDCEPLELGSVMYGSAPSDCNRSLELGDLAVVEYATVMYAEQFARKTESGDDDVSNYMLEVLEGLGPQIRHDRFMLRWDGCDRQTWSRGDCEYLIEDGTVAESERLFREFLGI